MLDGITALREFPTVEKGMTCREGMKILAGRLGLTGGKLRALVRDRYPLGNPKEEKRGLVSCTVKCFLKSDIMFTDVLHAKYEEMSRLGAGRRYLTNRILRAVVAGTCDAFDGTGRAGDFPPRSWMSPAKAEEMRLIQEKSLKIVKDSNSRLLQSIKVRLRMVATPILLELSERCSDIRTAVGKAARINAGLGLRCLSELMVAYRKKFFKRVRSGDLKNRRRARKKKKFHKKPTDGFGTVSRRLAHRAFGVLYRGATDLKKLVDPNVPNWYRRPTDADWKEGMRGEHRTPVSFKRVAMFKRYGLGSIPGITEPVKDSEWSSVKTEWSMKEARMMPPLDKTR